MIESMETTVQELARFLGEDVDDVKQKVMQYHPRQLAEEWKAAPHESADDVREFYKGAQSYLYELVAWNHTPQFFDRIQPLLHYRERKILEIGAGNGSLCISLALNGNKVTYCDISERLFEFAAQRFHDRLLPIEMVKSLKGQRGFDMVVAIDFFEHVHKDALPGLLKEITACLKDGGFLYHRSNFGQQGLFPMHFDHSAYFEEMALGAGLVSRPGGDLVKQKESKGVQISIPVRGHEHKASLTRDIMALDCPPHARIVTCEDYPVDIARNKLVKQLNRDWLFFMDADQTFHPDTLKRLMQWNMNIVSGITFKRVGEPIPMVYQYRYEVGQGHYYLPMVKEIGEYLTKFKEELKDKTGAIVGPPFALLECDGVSTGCLLIHRRVFDAIEEPWFECDPGTKGGEDFNFCRKAQEAGFKIYADPSVMTGHYSEYVRGFEHFNCWADKAPFPWGAEEDPNARREKIQ